MLEAAGTEQMAAMIAHCDQPRTPRRSSAWVGSGTQLRAFPRAVMDACYSATEETLSGVAEKNPQFAKLLTSWRKFRDEQNLWFRVAENTLDGYRSGVSAAR
jgi:TRAP-type mannitol/chloroaromatic compound transport system substrate-binding protein